MSNRRTSMLAAGACLAAVTSAALIWRGSGGSPEPRAAPSPASLCEAAATTSFVVNEPGATPRSSPVAAAARWVGRGETTTVTRTDAVDSRRFGSGVPSAMVSIGRDGRPVREVLVVARVNGGWYVDRTVACLDKSSMSGDCAVRDRVEFNGATYGREDRPRGTEPGVGRILGTALVQVCVHRRGHQLVSRGRISPVTAFSQNEVPPSHGVTISRDEGDVLSYVPVRE